jgi:hypothetical protein
MISADMIYLPSVMTIRWNIQVILRLLLSTIWEAAVLVLLTGVIYEARSWESIRWHDIHTKFHKDRLQRSTVVKEETHEEI